jgi:hypothetical protein
LAKAATAGRFNKSIHCFTTPWLLKNRLLQRRATDKGIDFAIKWKIEKRPDNSFVSVGFDGGISVSGRALFLSAIF